MSSAVNTNLTRAEVQARARLVRVESYRIEVDLTSSVARSAAEATEPPPAGGDDPSHRTFVTTTTIRFDCSEPGRSTWVDLLAVELLGAELNGKALPASSFDGARIPLAGLAAHNVLTVRARCAFSTSGEGLHRAVDPADGEVYLYTQFATAEARRVFACFEQPDLKATFTWHVVAPVGWTVLSTSPTPVPAPVDAGRARWDFEATPLLPTYLAVLVAGPFHSVTAGTPTAGSASLPLGVHVRRSVARHLDADEILDVTRAGLAHYERLYGVPFPFPKYDQVFLPEFNLGAMENPGVVTFNEDHFIFRTDVTDAEREERAVVILHEMAHMWFGDLVTMLWWDDVWLNESFAEWAGTAVAAEATRFTEAWTTFAQSRKAWAYRCDQLPSTHPIAADMVDLEAVYANFDGITYAKGASVLRQLVAYVGREAFESGLAEHLREHAWGSATLADLLVALSRSSGRDLHPWAQVWLQLPGVTSVHARAEVGPDGRYRSVELVQEAPIRPEGVPETLRPHRIAVGAYQRQGDRLIRVARAEVDLPGAHAMVPQLVGVPAADLLLVNDDDLTYVKARLDERSLATALAPGGVGALADSLPRALVWGALWEHVRDGQLAAQDFVAAALVNLDDEQVPRLVETVLTNARQAVEQYVDPGLSDGLATRSNAGRSNAGRSSAGRSSAGRLSAGRSCADLLCARTGALLDGAEPGSDRQRALAMAHFGLAYRPAALDRLDALRTGDDRLPGLPLDADLRWAIVQRLAARGRLSEADIDLHAAADRTSKGVQAAARARASRPVAQAKRTAWDVALNPGSTPNAVLAGIIAGFADPGTPVELLLPYAQAYADDVPVAFSAQDPMQARAMARGLFPPIDDLTVDVADSMLARTDLPGGLRRVVVEARSEVQLALRCRRRSAEALHGDQRTGAAVARGMV